VTKVYLVLDDQGDRLKAFPHDDQVRLTYVHALDNVETVLRQIDEEPGIELAGIIVDFHLLGDRPADLNIDSPNGESLVRVGTGLGAMLYLRDYATVPKEGHVTLPRDLPLFALTTRTQPHHAFFYSAANLWFGARPIDALMDMSVLHAILASDSPASSETEQQEVDSYVLKAKDSFIELLDSCLRWRDAPEAYDWFSILRLDTARYTFTTLSAGLSAKFGTVRDYKGRALNENFYASMLRIWQQIAADYVTAWGGSTAGWPDTAGAHHPKRWNDHNPVLDLMKDGIGVGGRSGINAYGVFFSEPDVREALLYWRITKSDQAEWRDGRIVYGIVDG
jgi:hypothetical protein